MLGISILIFRNLRKDVSTRCKKLQSVQDTRGKFFSTGRKVQDLFVMVISSLSDLPMRIDRSFGAFIDDDQTMDEKNKLARLFFFHHRYPRGHLAPGRNFFGNCLLRITSKLNDDDCGIFVKNLFETTNCPGFNRGWQNSRKVRMAEKKKTHSPICLWLLFCIVQVGSCVFVL